MPKTKTKSPASCLFSLAIPIYGCDMVVSSAPTIQEAFSNAVSISPNLSTCDILPTTCGACLQSNYGIFLLLKSPTIADTLAHEAFHASHELLAKRGITTQNKDGEEAHAYLYGWMINTIIGQLSRHGVDVIYDIDMLPQVHTHSLPQSSNTP